MFCLLSCKQGEPPIRKQPSDLFWSDEFNDTKLDENNWDYQLADGCQYGPGLCGWGNNEKQYYRKENVSVSGGNLLIKSIKEDFNSYEYTSARIRTLNKFDFKYGKIEARMRMANAPGLWHALWMLPSKENSSWPLDGEIDIMEYVGNEPLEIFNTIHFENKNGTKGQLGDLEPIDAAEVDFHVFGLEWNENEIIWYIDEVETYHVIRTDLEANAIWPFDGEFHLLLNTAVGGNLGGQIDDSRLLKAKYMEVDYIRVYK